MIWKRFKAELDQLHEMLEFILAACEPFPRDSTVRSRIELVAEEILVNIISYAYPGASGNIEVGVERDSHDVILIRICDEGIPFNPLEAKEESREDITLEEHPIGGWGLGICRKISDDVSYLHQDGKNQLTVKINLKPA